MNYKISSILCLTFLTLFAGCADDMQETQTTVLARSTAEMSNEEAQKLFASTLSKAVYNNEALRRFLKEKALEQFDNDYDVFYPLTKDEVVDGSKTFRTILLENGISDEELSQIEHKLPLLTIYVPDFTMFENVSAKNWDTSNKEVPVGVNGQHNTTLLYCNGTQEDELEGQEIPESQILYIKNNERICKTPQTRSADGMSGYAFTSNAFDGRKNKTVPQTRALNDYTPLEDDYIQYSELNQVAIDAWNVMKNYDKSLQRDYVYYGLTPQKQEGKLDRTIHEYLYRFQIDPNAYFTIADQTNPIVGSIDPTVDPNKTITHKKTDLPDDEIIRQLWTDGSFEIQFQMFTGVKSSTNMNPQVVQFSARPQDLFNIQITRTRKHKTWFHRAKYTYKIDPHNMKPKWFYPRSGSISDVRLDNWDLSQLSLQKYIYVYEVDKGTETTRTDTQTTTYTENLNADTSIGDSKLLDFKFGLGYNSSTSKQKSSSITIKTTDESDALGTLNVSFYDPIISSESSKGYYLYPISNGTVKINIAPLSLDATRG